MSNVTATALIGALKSPLMLIGADDRVVAQNAAITNLLNIDFTGRHYITALRQPATIDAVTQARADHVTKTARYLLRINGKGNSLSPPGLCRERQP